MEQKLQTKLTKEVELGDNLKDKIFNDDQEEIKQSSPANANGNGPFTPLNSRDGEDWTSYKCMTWNLWCIPVSSPRCLSNPDRCSKYLYDIATKQQWQNYDGLIVVALQELWCWKTGIFPPILLRLIAYLEYIPYIGRFFAALFSILSLLFGVLPILKCLPIKYDPKSRFIHRMRHYLPYAFKNSDIPYYKFMDNGLAILCNRAPSEWGFRPYEHDACDDSCVNKGWLWCYFEAQRLMIINTHMQAAGAGYERLLQIKELKLWLSQHWESKGLVSKCIMLGDFNIDMESHPQRVRLYNDKIKNGMATKNHQLLRMPPADHEEDDEDDEEQQNEKEDPYHMSDAVVGGSSNDINNNKNNNSNGHKDGIIEIALKINADIYEELGDDVLTCLECGRQGKESLADNLRKLKMGRQLGKRRKFIKKAYINIPYHLGPNYHKLNRYEPTFKRAEYNIDHIFVNFECHKVKNSLLALGRYTLSDHRLVVSEFTTH